MLLIDSSMLPDCSLKRLGVSARPATEWRQTEGGDRQLVVGACRARPIDRSRRP